MRVLDSFLIIGSSAEKPATKSPANLPPIGIFKARFSFLENSREFFSFSHLVLDLEPFQFHFHFSKKSEVILLFTFHISKKVKDNRISLFFLEKKE